MKKLSFLLLLLLPLTMFISCSTEDEFPQVDLTVEFQNASQYNGNLYAVRNKPLSISRVYVTSLSGQNTALTSVSYYYDRIWMADALAAPYTLLLDLSHSPGGENLLQLFTNILQVDKRITSAQVQIGITVVDSVEDLPEGASKLGTQVLTFRIDPKAKAN